MMSSSQRGRWNNCLRHALSCLRRWTPRYVTERPGEGMTAGMTRREGLWFSRSWLRAPLLPAGCDSHSRRMFPEGSWAFRGVLSLFVLSSGGGLGSSCRVTQHSSHGGSKHELSGAALGTGAQRIKGWQSVSVSYVQASLWGDCTRVLCHPKCP